MKRLLRTFLPTSILLLIFQKACDLWCELSLITVWVPSYYLEKEGVGGVLSFDALAVAG